MKPVLVLQHLEQDGPAYLATWLRRRSLEFDVFNSEAGDRFPEHIRDHSALAVLGGAMGANDPLPSLRQAERLILDAMEHDVPVLGHCLGAQLMAKALGARVVPSPAPEIGWHRVQIARSDEADGWFGGVDDALVFQWHYDAFDLPALARRLACSDACANQAFAIGAHLAMQFHVELDAAKLQVWAEASDERFAAAQGIPTVQSKRAMLANAGPSLNAQQHLADRIYSRWIDAAQV